VLFRSVTSFFARREASLAGEIAKVALQADRIQDQLQTLRQLRSGPVNTLMLEARRQMTAG
jgi:hypothetical protein